MTGAYRDRPETRKRVVLYEPFPRSAAMVFGVQVLLMAGGLISTTLTGGHKTTLECNHFETDCTATTDGGNSVKVPLAQVTEARVVPEPLSNGSLARLGLAKKDGSIAVIGHDPHPPELVAEHVRRFQDFITHPNAPYLALTVDVASVRPNRTTFLAIAAVLLVPLGLILLFRRSARVEVDEIDRSLRIVRSRGPFPLRSTTLRFDEIRAPSLETKPGARLAYRVVLVKKSGEAIPLVDGWSPREAPQRKTIEEIAALLDV